jgi:hypothetical protein
VLEGRYPFLKLINEEQKRYFYNCEAQTKHDIIIALESSVYTSGADVVSIMEAVVADKNKQVPNYIKLMPDKYKKIYENMSQEQKNSIALVANGGMYKLNTPYQVKSFWDSQRFDTVTANIADNNTNQSLANNAQKINESQSKEGMVPVSQVQELSRGYSDTYLQTLKSYAARR